MKKKLDEVLKWKQKLFDGMEKVGKTSTGEREWIWEALEASAAYSFNKSHAVDLKEIKRIEKVR